MHVASIHNNLLICTGAPDNPANDKKLAEMVGASNAVKVVMGGTTAKIISRELGRELDVDLRPDPSGLPPVSHMDGIDVISEGVLTLTAVRNELIEEGGIDDLEKPGVKYKILKLIHQSANITIIEGTKVNKTHESVYLPIKLEKRHDLLIEIVEILRSKYSKNVSHQRI